MARGGSKEILDELNNESNNVIADLTKKTLDEEFQREKREMDEIEFQDSIPGQIHTGLMKAAKNRKEADELLKESKGKVLADGRPQNRFKKPAIDPNKSYENFPIKEIDGVPVVLIGAVPFFNKDVQWDENYRHLSEHFTQCEHPNYHNAVYCKIRYSDLFKQVSDAWVIRTDEETQLWRAKEVG